MKRTKRLTRKQTIEQNRQRAQQPKTVGKLAKTKQMFSLMSYLKRKAENKLALTQFREGKRTKKLEGKQEPEHVHTEDCEHEHSSEETIEVVDPVIEMAKEAEEEVENAL